MLRSILVLLLLASPAYAGRYLPAIAIAIATAPATPDIPTPPAPSGECTNCNGTGKLGDGTVFVDCPVCGGDGRLDTTAGERNSGSVSVRMESTPAVVSLSADQQPAPMSAVTTGLWLLRPTSADTLADIGCGHDCRWGITAARVYGCRVLAVEIDPATAESARRYVAKAGLSHLVEVRTGDATAMDLSGCTIGCGYLWPETLEALRPQIERLNRFVSFAHAVPGLTMSEPYDGLHLYVRQQLVRVPVQSTATWGGRTYTRAVCNRAGCSMCAAIRSQLATPQYRLEMQPAAPGGATRRPAAPAVAEQPKQPAGRWVRVKVCNNGRCSYQMRFIPE